MAVPAEIPGALMAGTYRLVRPLSGESGRVYEARHDRLGGRLVVKLFDDADPVAFQTNARLASALRHPGIAQVLDYGAPADPAQGRAFVVMEHIDGRQLSAIIAEAGL